MENGAILNRFVKRPLRSIRGAGLVGPVISQAARSAAAGGGYTGVVGVDCPTVADDGDRAHRVSGVSSKDLTCDR
jgi:hypothetical protein